MAIDQELLAYLDARFGAMDERFRETNQQIQGLQEATQKNSEDIRLLGVRVEGLQHQVQLVAEGVAANTESLESFKGVVDQRFNEMRATMETHYTGLDRRVRRLEHRPL